MRSANLTLRRMRHTLLALLVWVGVGVAPYGGMLGARLSSSEPPPSAPVGTLHPASEDAHAHHHHTAHEANPSTAPHEPAPDETHHGEHHDGHRDGHHGLHCALCVVGAGLLAVGVSLPFRLVSRTLEPQYLTPPPHLRLVPHHRSRAPPGTLVTF